MTGLLGFMIWPVTSRSYSEFSVSTMRNLVQILNSRTRSELLLKVLNFELHFVYPEVDLLLGVEQCKHFTEIQTLQLEAFQTLSSSWTIVSCLIPIRTIYPEVPH